MSTTESLTKPHRTRVANCKGRLAEPRARYDVWAYWWPSHGAWYSRPHTKRNALDMEKFTPEEKARWAPMLVDTWQAIAPDALQACRDCGQRVTKSIVVEYVCDANRVQMFGGMTDEEYQFLCVVWNRPAGVKWLNEVLGGYA